MLAQTTKKSAYGGVKWIPQFICRLNNKPPPTFFGVKVVIDAGITT